MPTPTPIISELQKLVARATALTSQSHARKAFDLAVILNLIPDEEGSVDQDLLLQKTKPLGLDDQMMVVAFVMGASGAKR